MEWAAVRHHQRVGRAPSAPGRSRLTVAAAGAAVLVALAGSAAGTAFATADPAGPATALATAFVIGCLAVVGAIVAIVSPDNRVGWLLLCAAAVLGAGQALTEAGVHGVLISPGSVPGAAYYAAVGPALRGVGWLLAVVVVPVFFPDGRLPGPRWRWLAGCAVAAAGCLLLGSTLSQDATETRLVHWHSPLGLPPRYEFIPGTLSGLGVLLSLTTSVGAVAGLVTRWRRDGPIVRQQLVLLALAACPPAVLVLAVLLFGGLPGWLFAVTVLPLPVAIAVATLSFGLYDLRRAANRTLLWLTMSGAVVGIYVAVVVTAAAVMPDHHSWLPAASAAAVAALLLIPLRESLQRAVNRVVYGRWREPYEVLAALGEGLSAAADVDRLLDDTVTELTTGLDLGDVSVRDLTGTVVSGATNAAEVALPLQAYGSTVGWLAYRPPTRQLSASEQRLIHDLAHHLGGAMHVRALREDVLRARERLVLAREEERRRLRRDLHDGIGPALAGLGLKTETTLALLPPAADAAARQLEGLSDEIRRAVIDVRRVVEGLRPPALDELGLVAACALAIDRLTAEADVTATVLAPDDLPALPAAVEVATYRIVIEAVTNIVRHGAAHRCEVSITLEARAIAVVVNDDGVGLGMSRQKGNGLGIMRERAEELGGTFQVSDNAPGVRVEARLPVAATPVVKPRAPAAAP